MDKKEIKRLRKLQDYKKSINLVTKGKCWNQKEWKSGDQNEIIKEDASSYTE